MAQYKRINIYKPGGYPHILENEIGEIWFEVGEYSINIFGIEIETRYVNYALNNCQDIFNNPSFQKIKFLSFNKTYSL